MFEDKQRKANQIDEENKKEEILIDDEIYDTLLK